VNRGPQRRPSEAGDRTALLERIEELQEAERFAPYFILDVRGTI
jgi:hypothetical protein